MTLQPVYPDERFQFDKHDRIRRALRVSGTSNADLAEYLEVSTNTVGNWTNGRAWPRHRDLKRIALRTGFPVEWLESGTTPTPNGPVTGVYQMANRTTPRKGAGSPVHPRANLSSTGHSRLAA